MWWLIRDYDDALLVSETVKLQYKAARVILTRLSSQRRFSGVPNAVVRVNRVKDEQNLEGQNQQNVNEENVSWNVSNSSNRNRNALPQLWKTYTLKKNWTVTWTL